MSDTARRVLVVNQYAFPREYGGITRTFDQFSRLRHWTMRIISTSRNHYTGEVMASVDPRFTLVPLPASDGNGLGRVLGWGLFAAEAVVAGLRLGRLDVVFGSSPQLLAPVAAWVLAKLRRVPFVIEVRDLWPESLVTGGALRRGSALHRVLVCVEKFLYRQASAIVVVTTGWETHFTDLGIPLTRVTVIGNGADLADFAVAQTRDELRARHSIDGFTAVFSGNHSSYVGLELIVAAAEALPEVNFLLIGSGSRKQWAVDEVARLGLTNVRFHDQVSKPELVGLLKACDAGLHTIAPQSVFDKGMSPNKLFDYLGAGLPAVTNARVPLREVISDDEVGAVVEPEGLVEGIVRVRDADRETRARWVARGQQLMAERFSLDASARKLEAVLDRVVGQ